MTASDIQNISNEAETWIEGSRPIESWLDWSPVFLKFIESGLPFRECWRFLVENQGVSEKYKDAVYQAYNRVRKQHENA
jgi:hypothetical protein